MPPSTLEKSNWLWWSLSKLRSKCLHRHIEDWEIFYAKLANPPFLIGWLIISGAIAEQTNYCVELWFISKYLLHSAGSERTARVTHAPKWIVYLNICLTRSAWGAAPRQRVALSPTTSWAVLSHLPAAVHSLEDISVSQPHKERVRVESRARIYVCPDGPGFHNIHWDWVVCVPPLGSKLDSIF